MLIYRKVLISKNNIMDPVCPHSLELLKFYYNYKI
jgi:hypothetical protein